MPINLHDYAHTAAQRGWGAGWPSCAGAKSDLAIVSADRSGVRVSVRRRIARLVDLLLDETERRGYLMRSGQTGGYNCRAIAGTNSPSNHSWGLAIDINWLDNPCTTNTAANHIPPWMPPLWNRYGFAWGGHYTGKHDFMHFEFMGSPADADQMTALALHELTATEPDQMDQEENVTAINQGTWERTGEKVRQSLACPVGPDFVAKAGWFSLFVGNADAQLEVIFVGKRQPNGDRTYLPGGYQGPLPFDDRKPFWVPPGTEAIVVTYTSDNPITWCTELFLGGQQRDRDTDHKRGVGDRSLPSASVKYPADVVDLSPWKLKLPVVKDGKIKEVRQPELRTYSDKFFALTDDKTGIRFRCYHGGGTTSRGANPRCDLREMTKDGKDEAKWATNKGKHTLIVRGQVNRLTEKKPHVVLAEINGPDDDITAWRLEGTELYLTKGDNTHAHVVANAFRLGVPYELGFEVSGGEVKYLYNGRLLDDYSLAVKKTSCYFQAGDYLQSNPVTAPDEHNTEYAEVVMYGLIVQHAS